MFGLPTMDGIAGPCSAAAVASDTSNAYLDEPATVTSPVWSLPELPFELIEHILCYLSPVELASVCLVNHKLRAHALDDRLWRRIVQANVPGQRLTTSGPCVSFRELYIAHDPHWFLTKYKIWFGDKDLTGKLMLARYNQTTGVISGYQLLANSTKTSSSSNPNLIEDVVLEVHDFEPELRLFLDRPMVQLNANSRENVVRPTARTATAAPASTPSSAAKGLTGIAARWVNTFGTASTRPTPQPPVQPHRFAAETPMPIHTRPTDTIFSNFMLAKTLPAHTAEIKSFEGFPYGNMWPPPAIPATERVASAHYMNGSRMLDHIQANRVATEDRPTKRSEISEKTFRVRSWLERPAQPSTSSSSPTSPLDMATLGSALFGQSTQSWQPSYNPVPSRTAQPSSAPHIWDSVTTYSTLDPEAYTPTADQPWKGIWVGDYSGHGCEFLLMKQHHATQFDEVAFNATRTPEETDEDFAMRKTNARRYRGSLEAVKLTGDPNVPRGECTFVAPDLGDDGFVTTIEEEKYAGTRVVWSRGHVAMTGFTNDRYITSQLLLISENRLAQYWVGYNHVSFFERVDIDKFLVPS